MCGRYRIKNPEAVDALTRRLFGLPTWATDPLTPRYNVAPSQEMPVLALDENDRAVVAPMRWGFVPYWEKEGAPKVRPINAQAENVAVKPMFQQAVQRRRCLVAADGFYEWQLIDAKTKQPFDIHLRDGRPFFFAGIYERATETRPGSFAILTTRPNALMEKIHARMPAILEGDAAQRWLARTRLSADELGFLTRPHDAADMEAVPVSSVVNSPLRDVPECLVPAAFPPPRPSPPDGQQELLF